MSKQAKAAIWFTACSILQKGISFITVPIFTRLLSTEQYGTYSLYLSWFQLLTIITSLYLYHGVFNNAMVKFENDRDRYISSMQGLTMTIWAAIFVIYLGFHNMWSAFLGLAPVIVVLMFLEMLVTPALSFWSGKQRFEYKYQRLVAVTLAKSIANPIISVIAVLLTDKKDIAQITSIVLVEIVFCGSIMILQFCRGKKFYIKDYWSYALGMAIPLLPHYLSGMVLNQGDRVMISKMVGTSEVAFYSVAYNIGMLVQIFSTAINNSFTPWVYQKIKAKNYSGISNTVNYLLLLIFGISLCLMLCSPELVLIFGSSKYASASYVIPPVAASVFFIFLYSILAIPPFYFEKTQFLLISSLAAAVVNIGLNYIFIIMFGYVAAGYTTLACYVIYSFGHYLISRRVLNKFLLGERLFNGKTIAILSAITILSGILSNFLFDYWYIRYGILAIGFIMVVLFRNKLKYLLKNFKKG
jgi:O-antigen/teichoic acid export membrane protein